MVTREEFYVDSADGIHMIHGYRWYDPEMEYKGVLQLVHGMQEYIERYQELAEYMASAGYFVVGHDHLGHGDSVKSPEELGYVGRQGAVLWLRDIGQIRRMAVSYAPKVPYIILGHSMGSFVCRAYVARFGSDMKAVALMGTSAGPGAAVGQLQLQALKVLVHRCGPKGHDPLPQKLSTGAYNKAFAPNRTPNDWVSTDETEVDRYTNDPLCGFPLTVSGYRDVAELLLDINKPLWYRKIPKHVPFLLLSGEQDPVGDFGKGVRKVYAGMRRAGCQVELKLYPGLRHALITEQNHFRVYNDLLTFFEKARTSGDQA